MNIPTFVPSHYKISTITATGGVNTHVCLDTLFSNVELPETDDGVTECVVYAEYGSRKTETIHKGHAKKLTISRRNSAEKKRFDNQVTLVCRIKANAESTDTFVLINSKVFKNGNIQMTGLKYMDQGRLVIDYIVQLLKDIAVKNPNVVKDMDKLESCNYKVQLINCDFRTGFEIKRDKLHNVLLTEYDVYSSFEPCIYPGLKIQYWYNKTYGFHDGCCHCHNSCTRKDEHGKSHGMGGKGNGNGEGQCKKITIAVFQSGCVIITGAQSTEQIDEAYDFICTCIRSRLPNIYKVSLPVPAAEPKKKKSTSCA